MSGPLARYGQVVDSYDQGSGKAACDPATATLLELARGVSGLGLLGVGCGQAGWRGNRRAVALLVASRPGRTSPGGLLPSQSSLLLPRFPADDEIDEPFELCS